MAITSGQLCSATIADAWASAIMCRAQAQRGFRDWPPGPRKLWPCRPGQAHAIDPVSDDSARLLFSSMEVAGAADVVVQQGRAVRGLRRRLLVEPVFEDRGDGGVRQHPDLDGAPADRLGARRI